MYAVADGMGGHAAGEVASRLAVESLAGASLDASSGENAVRQALTVANKLVFDRAKGSSRGMGTTCALLVLGDGVAHIGHVGDSRVYLLRDDALELLTRDHTLAAEMVDQGLIEPEQAGLDDNRGYLARALGGGRTVDVDVDTVELQAGDRFLLCSDGLSTMVANPEIESILKTTPDPQAAADLLVEAANAAGGEDNVTALVIDPATSRARPPSRRRRRMVIVAVALLVLAVVVAAYVVLSVLTDPLFQLGPTPSPTPGRGTSLILLPAAPPGATR